VPSAVPHRALLVHRLTPDGRAVKCGITRSEKRRSDFMVAAWSAPNAAYMMKWSTPSAS
jgi:hypothetical protein